MDALYFGLVVVIATVSGSIFEWTIHRFIMHKRFWGVGFAYEKHAITHHGIFKADETYHLLENGDSKHISMPWWSGPVLISILLVPVTFLSTLLSWWVVLAIFASVCVAYFYVYEYMHLCMHLPEPEGKPRWIERRGFFKFLNGHHLLHHRYPEKNLNVVLPLGDLLFGTLILRAPKKFPQPRGQSVPDVQPQ
jgi:hypothetical protein